MVRCIQRNTTQPLKNVLSKKTIWKKCSWHVKHDNYVQCPNVYTFLRMCTFYLKKKCHINVLKDWRNRWCWLPLGEIRSNFKHSDIFFIFYNKYVFFKVKNITEKLLILHYQLKTDHAISLWERRSWNRDPNYW